MKIEALKCPQCGADLDIAEDRDFYTCGTCGSKLRVDRSETGPTRLTRFETLLGRVVSQTRFLAASERLQILGGELDRANEAITQATALVETVMKERQTLKEKLQSAIQEKQGSAGLLALLALGAGFLLIRDLGGENVLLWLLAAVGLSGGAWYNYNAGKRLEEETPTKLQAADEQIGNAQASLAKAKAELQDLKLEEELCRRTKANFRMRGDEC